MYYYILLNFNGRVVLYEKSNDVASKIVTVTKQYYKIMNDIVLY